MAKETKEEFFKRLDGLGMAMVKTYQATNVYLNYPEKVWAIEWVERSNEATSAEQLALARAAASEAKAAVDAAREANVIAHSARQIARASVITAIAIAIAGTAVAVIVPHFWH